MALQMLYQSDLGGSPPAQIFSSFDLTSYLVAGEEPRTGEEAPCIQRPGPGEGERRRQQVREGFEYAKLLVAGTLEHREEIDRLIRGQADNWRLERMPAVDRNILRLAVYEMLYEQDVPKLVVMDEAIELAKQFGSEQSGRFVNGLLDGLLKTHRFPGKMS
jgi:transcription antitermination factor NusB